MLPSSFTRPLLARDRSSSNDVENIVDTPRLFILEFLNIQQCIVFAEDTRRLCASLLPLAFPLSLSLSLSLPVSLLGPSPLTSCVPSIF